jgi:hypothetical protein
MNDTMSLVLATSILAIGGVGLYLFKNNSDDKEGENEEYNEDNLFNSINFFGGSDDDEQQLNEEDDIVSEDSYEYKPRSKKNGKTKRARKTGGTKRRY